MFFMRETVETQVRLRYGESKCEGIFWLRDEG